VFWLQLASVQADFRSGDRGISRGLVVFSHYQITLDTTTDIITDVRGTHQHENKLLVTKIQVKVVEAKKKALEGAYTKPRAVYSELKSNIEADPETRMGIGEFYH
jgi:hypothetical protein